MSDENLRTIVIPNGGMAIEMAMGKIFTVVSASGSFTIKKDGGTALPMATGRGFGDAGSPSFRQLIFTDTSGSANTVVFYAGNEPLRIPEPQTVALDPSSVSAVTPGQQTLKMAIVSHSLLVTYSDKRSIEVIAVSGTVLVDGFDIGAGNSVNAAVYRHQDKIDDVVVDATGGVARVTTLSLL